MYVCKIDYGGHNMKFHGNYVIVVEYDNQNCFNLGPFNPNGPGDVIYNNSCVLWSCNPSSNPTPDCDYVGTIDQCVEHSPIKMWDNNYYTVNGNASYNCQDEVRNITLMQQVGMEMNSTSNTMPSNWLSGTNLILVFDRQRWWYARAVCGIWCDKTASNVTASFSAPITGIIVRLRHIDV